MGQSLLTKKQLAERWSISISTLDRRVREGVIKPVRGMASIRFNIEDILQAEGTDNSKMSPFERRRLEREIEALKEENQELKGKHEEVKKQLTNVMAEIMPILQEN